MMSRPPVTVTGRLKHLPAGAPYLGRGPLVPLIATRRILWSTACRLRLAFHDTCPLTLETSCCLVRGRRTDSHMSSALLCKPADLVVSIARKLHFLGPMIAGPEGSRNATGMGNGRWWAHVPVLRYKLEPLALGSCNRLVATAPLFDAHLVGEALWDYVLTGKWVEVVCWRPDVHACVYSSRFVSSMRKGHGNLVCSLPICSDDLCKVSVFMYAGMQL